MLEHIVSNAFGFVIGGGLAAIFTLPFVRRLKRAESKLAEVGVKKAENEASQATIETLNMEVQLLKKRAKEQFEAQELFCKTCAYKQFYLAMENRLNNGINERRLKQG